MSFIKKMFAPSKLPTLAAPTPAPAPPPEKEDAGVQEAADAQRRRARLAGGRGGTILTSGLQDEGGKKASLLLGG